MKTQTNSNAHEGCAPLSCYASFWGKLLRKWDWWIYRKACGSLRRMTLDNPGMSYLMELNIRVWNEKLAISQELRHATERFHESMRNHSQHNDLALTRAQKKSHVGWSPYYKSSPMPACSVAVDLTDAENTVLDELCTQKDMTRQGVMLAALRLYQAVALGAAVVAWKSTGPFGCMGDDCPPNVNVEGPAGSATPNANQTT